MAIFRVEKTSNYTVMSNYHMRDSSLSWKAKGILSVMLSLPNEWDYSLKGLATLCSDGISSTASGINELESHGYLRRYQSRDKRGRMSETIYDVFEKPQILSDNSDKKIDESQKCENTHFSPCAENPNTVNPNTEKPITEKRTQLNTNKLNTNKLNNNIYNNLSYQSIDNIDSKVKMEKNDKIDMIDYKKNLIQVKQQIEYECLVDRYNSSEVDELVELITWGLSTTESTLKINGVNLDSNLVRDKLSQLDESHIEYILDCLEKNTTEIKQRRNYLLTCLYNAPSSIDGYYASQVNHDLYG